MIGEFSFVGVGACGGNQVACFKKYGVDGFYINTAIQDLESLNIDNMHYYHLEGALGCHKNRNVSKTYLANNCDDVLSHIERYVKGKYVFLFGSLGGGTSSGMLALLMELIESELNKIVIPIVTIPNFNESPQAKINCYTALEELFETAKHTIFVVDNNKEPSYDKSNNILAENIYSLISDISKSTDGIFDYSEILVMLECKGYGIISSIDKKNGQTDYTKSIEKAMKKNIFADIEERNSLYYLGIKCSINKKAANINFEELKLKYGFWKDNYTGYQSKSDLLFMSGLEYPSTMVNKLSNAIEEDRKLIQNDQQSVAKAPIFKKDIKLDFLNGDSEEVEVVINRPLSAREKILAMAKK